MCGRYFRRSDKQELAERIKAGVIDPAYKKPSASEAIGAGKKPATAAKPEMQRYACTVHAPQEAEVQTFAFAGLWDAWHNKADNTRLQSFTTNTT